MVHKTGNPEVTFNADSDKFFQKSASRRSRLFSPKPFSTTSRLPTNRPNGTHLTQAAAARRIKNFTCEIVLSSEFRKG